MTSTTKASLSKPLRWAFLLLFLWVAVAGLLTANGVVSNRTAQLDAQQSEFITGCTGRGGTDKVNPDTNELTCEKGARRPKAFEFEPSYAQGSLAGYAASQFLDNLTFGLVNSSS
ncbi:hypothetical protein [Phaeobacter piscinae]|uniref:hypothetical protein n=1 Tax=Phaeobacter piscinae TaxID=1580596 RepID=UPI00058B4997|nr:hypothetical protein [Phaeobacter piscinae]